MNPVLKETLQLAKAYLRAEIADRENRRNELAHEIFELTQQIESENLTRLERFLRMLFGSDPVRARNHSQKKMDSMDAELQAFYDAVKAIQAGGDDLAKVIPPFGQYWYSKHFDHAYIREIDNVHHMLLAIWNQQQNGVNSIIITDSEPSQGDETTDRSAYFEDDTPPRHAHR